jgi:predicted GIY-YIG superfamily endonuclease
MKVQELVPPLVSRVEFSLKALKFVPAETGCYVLATFAEDVLYVGLTANLQRRFFEHRDNKEKRDPTSAGMAFWFYYFVCKESELARTERTWLNSHMECHGELPVLNKMNSPVR